ncbi:DUF4383 domain-containing protein [Aeromicrobium flavum]
MQLAAAVVGAVFLVVGILGFIPGITSDYDTMEFAGHESEAMLLGIFQVSILHNIVHLLFGVAGLAMARTWSSARAYLIGGGVVYALLWLYGLFIDKEHEANFVPLNSADDWLHFVLALGMIALGLLLGRDRDDVRDHTGGRGVGRGDAGRRDTGRRGPNR